MENKVIARTLNKKIPVKRSNLINLVVEIPTLETLVAESLSHNSTILRERDAVDYLATALEIIAEGTQNEELVKEIIGKCIILSGYEDLAEGRIYVNDILKKD